MREASIVLPDPGGPIMSRPRPPTAATWNARFSYSCPATSAKSGERSFVLGRCVPTSPNMPDFKSRNVRTVWTSSPSSGTASWHSDEQTTDKPASRAQTS